MKEELEALKALDIICNTSSDINLNIHKNIVIEGLNRKDRLEKELGISLETLFSIIKGQKIYVKKLDKYVQCDFGVRNYGRDYVFIHRHGVVNVRCYKKTWALTKEELEK